MCFLYGVLERFRAILYTPVQELTPSWQVGNFRIYCRIPLSSLANHTVSGFLIACSVRSWKDIRARYLRFSPCKPSAFSNGFEIKIVLVPVVRRSSLLSRSRFRPGWRCEIRRYLHNIWDRKFTFNKPQHLTYRNKKIGPRYHRVNLEEYGGPKKVA